MASRYDEGVAGMLGDLMSSMFPSGMGGTEEEASPEKCADCPALSICEKGKRAMAGRQKATMGNSGLAQIVREAAREAVDAGLTECPCGQPDCELDRAIKAEIQRRNPASRAMDKQTFLAMVKDGEFQFEMAKVLVSALEVFEQRKRERAWYRVVRHKVVAGYLHIRLFLQGLFHLEESKSRMRRVSRLAAALGIGGKEAPPKSLLLGIRVAEWIEMKRDHLRWSWEDAKWSFSLKWENAKESFLIKIGRSSTKKGPC